MYGTKKQKQAPKALPEFNPAAKNFIAELERLNFCVEYDYEDCLLVGDRLGPEDKNGHEEFLEDGFSFALETKESPYCCGITEFGKFEFKGNQKYEYHATKHVFEQLISNSNSDGMLLATDLSNTIVSQVLRELGFTETTFHNPNSGNNVSMFTKVMNKSTARKRK